MEVMYFLIAFSLLLAGGFLLAFFWAMKNGQYDDTYTPAVRMLFEENTSDIKAIHTQSETIKSEGEKNGT